MTSHAHHCPGNCNKKPGETRISTVWQLFCQLVYVMPLGSFFSYKLLSNVACSNKALTAIFISACGLGCFFTSCFTNMVMEEEEEDGGEACNNTRIIRYGCSKCLKTQDFIHAVSSTVLFAAVALTDQNSVNAFYPCKISDGTMLFLRWLPILVGFASGCAVLKWPSSRRGLGYLIILVSAQPRACGCPK